MKNHFKLLTILILGGLFIGGVGVWARKPEPTTSTPQTVYINNVPFTVTSEADKQAKTDLYYNTIKTLNPSTPEAKLACQKIMTDMLQAGYKPPELRKPEEKIPQSFFQPDPQKVPLTKEVSSLIAQQTGQYMNQQIPELGIDKNLVQQLEALQNVASQTKEVADVMKELEKGTAIAKGAEKIGEVAEKAGKAAKVAVVVAKALDYQQKYEAWQKSGGRETDQNGVLTSEYLAAANAGVDFIGTLTPDYLTPVLDTMKDMGETIQELQQGKKPRSQSLGSELIQSLPLLKMYQSTIEAINGHFDEEDVKNQKGGVKFPGEKLVAAAAQSPQETIPLTDKSVVIATKCPLNFLVISPQGKRAGIDPQTGEVLEEIPSSFVVKPQDYEVEAQFVLLPYLEKGEYKIELSAFGNGAYNLFMKTYDLKNVTLVDRQVLTGTVRKGEVLAARFNPYAEDLEKKPAPLVLRKKNNLLWILIGGIGGVAIAGSFIFYLLRRRK